MIKKVSQTFFLTNTAAVIGYNSSVIVKNMQIQKVCLIN